MMTLDLDRASVNRLCEEGIRAYNQYADRDRTFDLNTFDGVMAFGHAMLHLGGFIYHAKRCKVCYYAVVQLGGIGP